MIYMINVNEQASIGKQCAPTSGLRVWSDSSTGSTATSDLNGRARTRPAKFEQPAGDEYGVIAVLEVRQLAISTAGLKRDRLNSREEAKGNTRRGDV